MAESVITGATCDIVGLYATPDLRDSELDGWEALVRPLAPSALLAPVMERLRVDLTEAAITFASEHPDATRP